MDWTKQGAEAFSYLKGIGNKVKQIALQLTEVEIKVEDATNNDPWGPHGKDMAGEQSICPLDGSYWSLHIQHLSGYAFCCVCVVARDKPKPSTPENRVDTRR